MIGLGVDGRPLLRAYSLASSAYDDHLEFFSIKVPDGPLTSRLQHLATGDKVYVSRKATGTLIQDNLEPGRHLYLLSTGTGLAPFLSLIQEPEIYERFERVILVHGTRYVSELAYDGLITKVLPEHKFLGEVVRQKLIYYPTVTREPFRNTGRITDILATDQISTNVSLPPLGEQDRVMICGSPEMVRDLKQLLMQRGLREGNHGEPAQFVVEKAFAER
jgi:ferredoxin--NADP+ reductase